MCAFGSKHKKPTSFLQVPDVLNVLARACPGLSSSHVHEELSGKVRASGSIKLSSHRFILGPCVIAMQSSVAP